MTKEELLNQLSLAIVSATSRKNQSMIDVLTEAQSWIRGERLKPDISLIQTTGTQFGFPKLVQLYESLMAYE
jgi:hypothetical protein